MPESVMIDNAIVFYAKFKEPALKYKKTADPEKPYLNKEYVVDILPTAKDMKELKKKWKVSVRAFRETKEYSAEEFKKAFKTELPPEEYCNADGTYETVKMRKHASQKDGRRNDPPTLYAYHLKSGKDKNGLSITQDTALGNGTTCKIQLTQRKLNTDSGKDMQLDLFAVQVIELVPYVTVSHAFEDHDEDFDDSDVKSGFEDHDEEESSDEDDDFA